VRSRRRPPRRAHWWAAIGQPGVKIGATPAHQCPQPQRWRHPAAVAQAMHVAAAAAEQSGHGLHVKQRRSRRIGRRQSRSHGLSPLSVRGASPTAAQCSSPAAPGVDHRPDRRTQSGPRPKRAETPRFAAQIFLGGVRSGPVGSGWTRRQAQIWSRRTVLFPLAFLMLRGVCL
jgi:hypothetical protein